MSDPALSIVVPFYQVEDYIEPCLKSLAVQSFTDFEVILVDDGATDSSLDIARTFQERDRRFRVVRQRNAGLGPARNTGVRHSMGRYLTFVDSDDLVPRHAYELLVRSLEETASDFACGDVRRFSARGVEDSWVHRRPFASTRLATHVRERPDLALDRMAWNKVYRRSFWDAEGLEYPSMLYEDYPVTIQAHVNATSVDVIHHPVYYWRQREGTLASITQRSSEVANIHDRVASDLAVLSFLEARAPYLLERVSRLFVGVDIDAILSATLGLPEADAREVLHLANRLIDHLHPAAIARSPPPERLQIALARRGLLAQLQGLVTDRRLCRDAYPLVRSRWRRDTYVMQLPLQRSLLGRVPRSTFTVRSASLALNAQVDDLQWVDDTVIISGRAWIGTLPMDEDSTLDVWLQSAGAATVKCATTRSLARGPAGTFNWCGFESRVSVRSLLVDEQRASCNWRLRVSVTTAGATRSGSIRTVAHGRARWHDYAAARRDLWVIPQVLPDGEFALRVRNLRLVASALERMDDRLVVKGTVHVDLGDAPRFAMSRHGQTAVPLGAVVGQGQTTRPFAAEVELQLLLENADSDDPVAQAVTWFPHVLTDAGPLPFACERSLSQPDIEIAGQVVSVVVDERHNLLLTVQRSRAAVQQLEWQDGGRLRVHLEESPTSRQVRRVILRANVPGGRVVQVVIPVTGSPSRADIEIASLLRCVEQETDPSFAPPLRVAWSMLIDTVGGLRALLAGPRVFRSLPEPTALGGSRVSIEESRGESVVIVLST